MTRRNFIQKVVETILAAAVGAWFLTTKTVPRKFVRAVKLGRFPGLVKPLQKIGSQGKWSG